VLSGEILGAGRVSPGDRPQQLDMLCDVPAHGGQASELRP
jgi:hypothetical protein